jgi:hypothetical protein
MFRQRFTILSVSFFVKCLLTAFAGLFLFFLSPIRAQTPPYDPVQDATYSPPKSYHGADIDSVDLGTGSLTVRVPLISYPQRGGLLHLDFTVVGTQPGAVLQKFYVPYQNGNQVWVNCGPGSTSSTCTPPNPYPALIFSGFPCVRATSGTPTTSRL